MNCGWSNLKHDDEMEYESTMEPMRRRLDWFMVGVHVLTWICLIWFCAYFVK